MTIKFALDVIKPHLPIFRNELIMEAWQTLEDYCTQPKAPNKKSTPCNRIGGCLKVIIGPEAKCKCDN